VTGGEASEGLMIGGGIGRPFLARAAVGKTRRSLQVAKRAFVVGAVQLVIAGSAVSSALGAPDSPVQPVLTNPSFDTNTAGWTPTGSTIARNTDNVHSPPASGAWGYGGGTVSIGDTLRSNFSGTFQKGVTYRLSFKHAYLGFVFSVTARLGNASDFVTKDISTYSTEASWHTGFLDWTPATDVSDAYFQLTAKAVQGGGGVGLDSFEVSVLPTIDPKRCSPSSPTTTPTGDPLAFTQFQPPNGIADLTQSEPTEHIDPPNWSQAPVFNTRFYAGGGADTAFERDPCSHVGVAVGGNRVYVSSEEKAAVFRYDSTSLAAQGPISATGLDRPRGIAYYRGELYVADSRDNEIFVLDPASGAVHRKFTLPGAFVISGQTLLDGLMLTGVDSAWGEAWATLKGSAGGGAVVVFDAQSGALRSVTWELPTYDCYANPSQLAFSADSCSAYARSGYVSGVVGTCQALGLTYLGNQPSVLDLHRPEACATSLVPKQDPERFSWWDAATSPDVGATLAHCRFLVRGSLGAVAAMPAVSTSAAAGTPSCSGYEYLDGIDAVWGMRSFLGISGNAAGEDGKTVVEYSLTGGDGTPPALVGPMRTWSPTDASTTSEHRDVAYNNRELRVDISGDLTTSRWLKGTKCLDYTVSDADIYVVGHDGQRWYELARNFQKAELLLDDQVVAFTQGGVSMTYTTAPQGQMCLDTAQQSSGPHRLEVKATVDSGKTASRTNEDLRLDNTAPTGRLIEPETYVNGTVTFGGLMEDPHSGSKTWRFEVLRPGTSTWISPCGDSAPDASGRATCAWDSKNGLYPDGIYSVRAQMVDNSSDGGNTGYTDAVGQIEVDNVEDWDSTLDAPFDDAGSTTDTPETANEPGFPPDDVPDDDKGDPYTGGALPTCAADDPYIQLSDPIYGHSDTPQPIGEATPELALLAFLALPVAPKIPVSYFEKTESDAEHARFEATQDGALRAFAIVEEFPGDGWLTTQVATCSQFPVPADPSSAVPEGVP
jgi:hypothetical protein